jgi:hypothetical protein
MSTGSAPPPLGDKAAARSPYVLDDEPEIGTLVATGPRVPALLAAICTAICRNT